MSLSLNPKNMNTHRKGRNNENHAANILSFQGWEICRPNWTRHGEKDFFNRWDLMAVKDGKIKWVQVKTNRLPPPAERERLSDFQGPGELELWVFYDGHPNEPRIINLR